MAGNLARASFASLSLAVATATLGNWSINPSTLAPLSRFCFDCHSVAELVHMQLVRQVGGTTFAWSRYSIWPQIRTLALAGSLSLGMIVKKPKKCRRRNHGLGYKTLELSLVTLRFDSPCPLCLVSDHKFVLELLLNHHF